MIPKRESDRNGECQSIVDVLPHVRFSIAVKNGYRVTGELSRGIKFPDGFLRRSRRV